VVPTDDLEPGPRPRRHRLSRRAFLGAVGGLTAGAGALIGFDRAPHRNATFEGPVLDAVEPFYGARQGGITTPTQSHTSFAALDVTTDHRRDLAHLLASWTSIAAKLTAGNTAGAMTADASATEPDSGEAVDLGAARLTVNFGFGPTLFTLDGVDRFGLAAQQPMQLTVLPAFPGDQLAASTGGGDLTVHACADDPQVAFHAVRQLVRAAAGVATLRWSQGGFNEAPASAGTPRNLLGFKDGTTNPATDDQLSSFVWVGAEGPAWMTGGTYLVVRRIRIDLGRWDGISLGAQEQTIGRHKASGAPLGKSAEFDALDLHATDASGRPVIPADAHVRLASPQENWGQMMLRRGYAYSNGVVATGMDGLPADHALDAGLLFAAYQRAPRFAFIPIFRTLAASDRLATFTAHTASAIAAIPPGPPRPGRWVGQQLLEA
jgi:deferrochelatase/peroxidase EfeB